VSLGYGAGALTIERLGPSAIVDLFAFLDEDPVLHVYLVALALRDALARPHDEFWAARRDGRIVALAYLGGGSGAILPLGDDEEALERLAAAAAGRVGVLPRRLQLIGPPGAIAPFEGALPRAGLVQRIARSQQYLALDRGALPALPRVPGLRVARPEDYPLVYDSGALLRLEELEEDPRIADGPAYARRVEEECRDGHTYLWIDAEGLCFRASVSAITADAAQISGVYTPPDRRGRGFARRGLTELCVRLFARCRSLCLFVNDVNAPALALYAALGFRRHAAWASVFYETR
jgi:ribosomal protein S18 acetylase RimI-like enzyme